MPIGAFRLNTLSAAMAVNSITATGGTISYITQSGINYKIHAFTTTGNNSFIVSSIVGSPTADILLVGGGGAGGGTSTTNGNYQSAGGGGGGAVVYQTGVSVTSQTYTIAVGTAGAGVSGAAGNAGVSSTGLGYTANGGGAGTLSTAATNGGGSGIVLSTGLTSTAGTYAYKGGNSIYGGALTAKAGGGGAGAGGAGVDATANTGGNGGAGIQNNIDGNNYYYGSGGGGAAGTTRGSGWDRTGTLQTVTNGYGNGSTSGAGNSATLATAQYGGGGGGSYTTAAVANAGGTGKQGIAIVRYSFTGDYINFISSNTSTSTSITLPATIQDGDIGILFEGAENTTTTIPTQVTPTGWTNIINTSQSTTAGLRMSVYYKVLTAAEASTSITGMTGTNKNNITFALYRPSKSFTITTASVNQQATASAPTNQTLTMTGVNNLFLGFYFDYTTGTGVLSSTTTATRTLSISGNGAIGTFEKSDSAISITTSTISMTDGGQQAMASFRLDFA